MKTPPGEYPLMVTGPAPLSSNAYQFDGEAVCIPMVSSTGHGHASLKRVHHAVGRFAVANIMTAAEVKDRSECNTRFLYLYLQHFKDDVLVPRMQGTANVSLSVVALGTVPVILPPLAEQERIVDLIGSLDDAIEAVEEQVCSLRRLSSSSRSKIFATLLESYPRTTAGEFFEVTLGRQKSARQLHGNHEIPYLRAANITAGALSISDVQTMNFDPKEQTKYSLRNGDVLVVEGGSVGQTAVWHNEIDGPVGFDKHVLRIRGRAEISAVAFANHWAQWCYESGRFEAEARGVTIKALGYQRAKNMTVPKASLAVQNETAEFLDAMDLAVHSSEETSASLRSLRSELLAALLSGSHTIPDSYDDLMAERVA